MKVQALRLGDPFTGASNLWPLGAALQFDALITLGTGVLSNSADIAIAAQTDDFGSPTAGWGLGLRGTSLVAFAVDNAGESVATVDLAAAPFSFPAGSLLHVGLLYADGGNIQLVVNGNVVDTTAMGGATAVNASVVPWVGAEDAAGLNVSNELFKLVSLAYSDSSLPLAAGAGLVDATRFGYFNPTEQFVFAEYIYNTRYSVLKTPGEFDSNAQAPAVLINQGSTQNAAETVGNLTLLNAGGSRLNSLSVAVG